jgi:hypothetical protein
MSTFCSPARMLVPHPCETGETDEMRGKNWTAAALLASAVAAGPLAGAAPAASAPKLHVAPTTVVAGNALTVRLSRTHGRRCVLSLRTDRQGSLVRYRRKISGGRTLVVISATSAPGPRIASVRCGPRRAVARFRVAAAVPPPTAAPTPDEQGFVAGTFGAQAGPAEGQFGGGAYPNARIADIALSKLGQDLTTPPPLDHGQCKQAVNDWVAAASGRTQVMGVDYYSNYARNGGTQVSRDAAVKGDIIQLDNPGDISNYYSGMHTAVVVAHTPGSNTFDVVDANWQLDGVVRRHNWDPYASAQRYGRRVTIWRMGAAESPPAPVPAPAPTPVPQPTPPPPPAPTWSETTGGYTNTWTNYTNAGGTQGPTIPPRQTVQIACKLHGFRVADGNTWWYRIASAPWSGTFYASADAFYNNGATSGSLVGTPFVDPAVRDC